MLNRNYLYIYDTFIQRFSRRKCRKFQWNYPDSTVPCKAVICNVITELCSPGLMLYKKKSQRRHAAEGKLDDIGT